MKTPSATEYYEALRAYYHKTKGQVPPAIVDKLQNEIKSITHYEMNHNPMDKSQVIINTSLNLLGRVIGSIIYSVLVIYVLQEVFSVNVPHSTKNILLLALVLVTFNAKFRLAKKGIRNLNS